MTWLRSALFNLFFFPMTFLVALLAMPLMLGPADWTLWVARIWAIMSEALLRAVCGIRLRIEGEEHLPRGGPALIAAKHQSAFDTILWLRLVPRPAYVLKQELLRIPFYGWLVGHSGMIPVDRQAGASAMRALVKGARAAMADNRQIVIFPEGTRTAPGERIPYQPGIAALAKATGLPVIPVATDSGRFWGRRSFRKNPGVMTLSVLPPLPAGLDRTELLARLEDAIETRTAELLHGDRAVDKSVDQSPAAA